MEKKWIVMAILAVLAVVGFMTYYLFFRDSLGIGTEQVNLQNPASGLSLEEAVAKFDEKFVLYVLYEVGANELHNSPLSSNEPKIKFLVDDEVYSAVVKKKIVYVSRDDMDNEDLIIKTTREEAVKMINDRDYVQESFSSGNSEVFLSASKSDLFLKGYLGLYSKLTGREIN